MFQDKQLRGWIRIAAIAIGVALVLLLALHAYSGDSGGRRRLQQGGERGLGREHDSRDGPRRDLQV